MPPVLPFGGLSFLIHLSIIIVGWVRDTFAGYRKGPLRIIRGMGKPRQIIPLHRRFIGWSLPGIVALPFLIVILNISFVLAHVSGNTFSLVHNIHLPHSPAAEAAAISYPSCEDHMAYRLAIYSW